MKKQNEIIMYVFQQWAHSEKSFVVSIDSVDYIEVFIPDPNRTGCMASIFLKSGKKLDVDYQSKVKFDFK